MSSAESDNNNQNIQTTMQNIELAASSEIVATSSPSNPENNLTEESATSTKIETVAASNKDESCSSNENETIDANKNERNNNEGILRYDGENSVVDKKKLKILIVEEGVESLPDRCFYDCELLEEVQLPSTLTSIDEWCFIECNKLRRINIPENVKSLPRGCFSCCELLEEVQLPSMLTSIGDECFMFCKNLQRINLPENLKTIDQGAFSNCLSLELISIPESVESIGSLAFQECGSLNEITIPSRVKCIEKWTFENCVLLEKVRLPQNLQSIEASAFLNCWKLKDINLPNGINSIHSSAFHGCMHLPFNTMKWPTSNEEEIRNNISESISDDPWLPSKLQKLRQNINLKEGPGASHNFGGKTQRGYGPEWWAISREQLEHFKTHPAYRYLTMRQFVTLVLEELTDGLGIGYALLVNQEMPLMAKIMISHAWDEPLHEFVENILSSGEEGPFWICSTGIYQNMDETKGVTISEQIGPSPEHSPFATVLQVADRMLAVITSQCNIYTRLWCVYELFIASKFGVPVTLRPFIAGWQLKDGWLKYDACIANIGERIDSQTARCGNPKYPPNEDEIAIRETINQTKDKFESVDEAVELFRLIYLLHYPTDKIEQGVTSARDNLKNAIETVIVRLPLFRHRIMKYNEFVQKQLSLHHGFHLMERPDDFDSSDNDNYKINYHHIVSESSSNEKIDVFDAWCKSIVKIIVEKKK